MGLGEKVSKFLFTECLMCTCVNTLSNLSSDPIKQLLIFHFTGENCSQRSSHLSKIILS